MTSVDTHGVDDDIQSVVEDTGLPPRLRERIYRTVSNRDEVDADTAEQIAQLVQAEYEETRVEPLEPVGTVSAQSIGEPGTQMSIPADERILVRRGEETDVTEIGSLVDGLLHVRESQRIDDHEVARAPEHLEVLSLRADEQVDWKPVEEVSRHETPDELLHFELESGRTIRSTKSHSFVTRRENEVVPVSGDDLTEGDWLPVVSQFDADGLETIDLREFLPTDEYWCTSAVTDGGAVAVPDPEEHVVDTQLTSEVDTSDEQAVYSLNGTASLPERFPLDTETGFFVGAFLAAGTATESMVTITSGDVDFQGWIRSVADRFDLSVTETETESPEEATLRIDEPILADLLGAICERDGEKTVPDFAFGASESFVTGLLSGYFSAEGHVENGEFRASAPSEYVIEGIALLLARVGVFANRQEAAEAETLRIRGTNVVRFDDTVEVVGQRAEQVAELVDGVESAGSSSTDHIPNFGADLKQAATEAGIQSHRIERAHKQQHIERERLSELVEEIGSSLEEQFTELEALERAVDSDVVWDRIESIEAIEPSHEYVYDVSVSGLETFTTAQGVVTHNTMNTFHYAGVAEIDVTQGLPRLIEIVDARKTPDTPTMKVYLEDEYADERERAHEVIWNIEATKILALGDVSTNVADMRVQIDLNEETLEQRNITAEEISSIIESNLGVEAIEGDGVIEFGPDRPSYRELLQLVEDLREVVFKGIEDISRVVVRKEERDDGEEEFVLYTEGSDFGEVLEIEGVDATRTRTNNIHEVYRQLGVEAARESIIDEMMETLKEQALDDVNVRHLMLVSDIMTSRGTIESIGRHGIAGSKESVLARAAYEVTVNHLLDAAIHGEVDDLNGVIENVIVGKPIKLGTGDVDLRMSSKPASGD